MINIEMPKMKTKMDAQEGLQFLARLYFRFGTNTQQRAAAIRGMRKILSEIHEERLAEQRSNYERSKAYYQKDNRR